jgi:23S rRNA (uracil1939-C5)-methyltransferase
LQHLSSAAQVAHKQAGILDALARAGVVPETVVDPLRGPTRGYRRRARLGAKWVEKKGRVLVGFRERDKRFVADLSECGILDGDAGRLIDPLARLLERSALRAAVPQIEVAVGDDATALVLRVLEDPDPDALAALAAFERTHAVTVCLQRGGLSTVCDLQGRSVVLSYRLPAHDVTIELAPTDFVQVHGVLNRAMVDRALDWLDVGPGDHVLDLFCGLGNFSLPLARRVATVTCIEGDAALVDRARANAVRNGIANAEFLAADLEREPLALPSGPFGRVLLDPPRSGAAAVAARLAHRRVPTVVYVSCGPDAFVADARTLVAAGYRLTRFGVMDLFPHTAHFETIARFEG